MWGEHYTAGLIIILGFNIFLFAFSGTTEDLAIILMQNEPIAEFLSTWTR